MRALEFIVLPYALSGFGVGFVVGLTGVGGGSLMTPLLVLLFGFHPATAVGTDLLWGPHPSRANLWSPSRPAPLANRSL